MATRHYRKTVRRRGPGQTGARHYDVTISEPFGGVEDARRRWERHRRETERRRREFERRQREKEADRRRRRRNGEPEYPLLAAIGKWLAHTNRKAPTLAAPSFDLQLWLSRSGETWVTLMQRVRDGTPVAYDLYVYTPGDFVWNLVGSFTEYRLALDAKDQWVRYAEHGGTYQIWLAQQAESGGV